MKAPDETSDTRLPLPKRRPRTPEEYLERVRARTIAGLEKDLRTTGAELTTVLEHSSLARHPFLVGGAAALVGLTLGPGLLRIPGRTLRAGRGALAFLTPLVVPLLAGGIRATLRS